MNSPLPNFVGLVMLPPSSSLYRASMVKKMGITVAATAVWAMMWVSSAVTTKLPSKIMLVFSPTTISIL